MIDLTVERELKSPNKWNGCHWRVKHRESQDWQMAIAAEMLTQKARRNVWALLYASNDLGPKRSCDERRRVSVARLVPSLKNFIKDDDNLRYSTKPLNDALKRLGLIHDDSRKWLEQTLPTQEVSTDGNYYTRIVIEPAVCSCHSGSVCGKACARGICHDGCVAADAREEHP